MYVCVCMCEGGHVECKYRETEDKVCVCVLGRFFFKLHVRESYYRPVALCRTDL